MANTKTLTPQKAEITGSPNQAYRLVRWLEAVVMDRLRSIQSLPPEKYGKSSSQLRAHFVYLAGVMIGAGEGHFTGAEIEGLVERHRPSWIDNRDYLYQWHRALKQARDPKNQYNITPQWPDDRPMPEKYKRPPAPIATQETPQDDQLDQSFMRRYANKGIDTISGLPGEFWLDANPVMVAAIAYFDGAYPDEPDADKTCGVKALVNHYHGQRPGTLDVVRTKTHVSVLHGYMTRSGMYIPRCPHCIHEEAIKLSKKIEKASENYTNKNLPIRYLETTEAEAKKLRLRINQRNKRDKDGILYNKARIPQENDQCIFFHDADDIEGTPLPADRGELYALVYTWVMDRPKGKRGSHGLATWGNQTVKGKEKKQGGGKKRKQALSFFVDDYHLFDMMLEAYLGKEISGKRFEFTVEIDSYFKWLHDSELDYVILDGEKNVIDKLMSQSSISLPMTKPPDPPPKQPPQERWTQNKAWLGEPVNLV